MKTDQKITTFVVGVEVNERITGAMLKQLRMELGESLSEFGLTLKRAIKPNERIGFSRNYIWKLEKDDPKFQITEEIQAAYSLLAEARVLGTVGIGGAEYVSVMAMPGQVGEGAFVKRSLRSKKCERPGCGIVFLGPGKYHDPECQRAWAKEKRKVGRR
jgi:hypothetical protein